MWNMQGSISQNYNNAKQINHWNDHNIEIIQAVHNIGEREREGGEEGGEPSLDIFERGGASEGGKGAPVRDEGERHIGVADSRGDPVWEQQILHKGPEVEVRDVGEVQGVV